MGIRITTDDRGEKVWRFDEGSKPSYAIRIRKQEGDQWISMYQPIRFRRGVDVANGTIIFIRSAFPTFDYWVKDEKPHKKEIWQILEFDTKDGASNLRDVPPEDLPDTFQAAEDEIPF